MDVAAGSCGKSMLIQSPSCRTVSVPESVSKAIAWSRGTRPVSQSTNAAASVACPQSSTSFTGVNHRRFQLAPSGKRNAVSECFSSAATCCIHAASAGPSGIQTPAVFPRNGELVKASTRCSSACMEERLHAGDY